MYNLNATQELTDGFVFHICDLKCLIPKNTIYFINICTSYRLFIKLIHEDYM